MCLNYIIASCIRNQSQTQFQTQVAQSTVLPRGKIQGEQTESTLISAESKKNAYYFDYTAKAENQPETHFRAIFSLALGATGGAGNVLITLTAQTPEHCYKELKPVFDNIIESYGKIKAWSQEWQSQLTTFGFCHPLSYCDSDQYSLPS